MKKKKCGKAGAASADKPKCLMQAVSVRIPAEFTPSNARPDNFLRDAGFRNIAEKEGFVHADAPTGDDIVVIEYDRRTGSGFFRFRLVRIRRGAPVEIDQGFVHLVMPNGAGSEFDARGEEVAAWQIVAGPASIERVPEKGPMPAVESRAASAVPEDQDAALEGYVETNLPSVAAAMEEDLVSRCVALPEARPLIFRPSFGLLKKISQFQSGGQIVPLSEAVVSRFTKAPEPSPSEILAPAEPGKSVLELRTGHNLQLKSFIGAHCGGSRDFLTVAMAVRNFKEDRRLSMNQMSLRLGEYGIFVSYILSACKLHESLRKLLDVPTPLAERLSQREAILYAKIPVELQPSLREGILKMGGKGLTFLREEAKRYASQSGPGAPS